MKKITLSFILAISLLILVNSKSALADKSICSSTGCDCSLIGIWDAATNTCVLTTDLSESLIINSNGITLDGNNHQVIGSGGAYSAGVHVGGKTGVTIKNLVVKQFYWAMYCTGGSSGNTFINNNLLNNFAGVYIGYFGPNTVTKNRFSNNFVGVYIDGSNNNIVTNNIASNNEWGFYIKGSCGWGCTYAQSNVISGNVASNNKQGIRIDMHANNNKIYNNNFISNTQYQVYNIGGGNLFNLPLPIGGNYWSDYTGIDSNGDGIGETPYSVPADAAATYKTDNYPFVYPSGWADFDGDRFCDPGKIDLICIGVDNCPAVANPDQGDFNKDGEGDACDYDDIDQDGICDGSVDVNYPDCEPRHCEPDHSSVWWRTCQAKVDQQGCENIGYCLWLDGRCDMDWCDWYNADETQCTTRPYCHWDGSTQTCMSDNSYACSVLDEAACGGRSDACYWDGAANECKYVGNQAIDECWNRDVGTCLNHNYCFIRGEDCTFCVAGPDVCPTDPQNDIDSDGICGSVDNCPAVANPDQTDVDNDGYGAACECDDNNNLVYPGATEMCDGVDNDCNALTADGSEETWLNQPTTCGLGVCVAVGNFVCQGGVKTDTCNSGSPTGSDDNCNGVDEDCDGTADEHYVPISTSCGLGECSATGEMLCVAGVEFDTCTAAQPTDEICDGLDNDCDGSIEDDGVDETWYNQQTYCGIGECASTGNLVCTAGTQDDTCTEGTPTAELCDNKDNNCNNQVDETIGGQPTDEDSDGINDCTTDKCLGTKSWFATQRLRSSHYDSSNINLAETYGCSCEQILYCKPGVDGGEYKFGCTQGTINIWVSQDPESWALDCQIDGKVVQAGANKPIFENTDGDWLIDIIDVDNDNDGVSDWDDSMAEDADPPGVLGHGTPDWYKKNK